MTRLRWVAAAAAVLGLLFGFWGGEYSTLDWWKLKRDLREQEREIARIQVELDSLDTRATALERDRHTQERVAREKFGMIRPGETLYRVEGIR